MFVVEHPAGAGPALARNLGAERAGGDVLVFVDADVEVHRDAFARIRARFESDPDLTAVFGSYDDAPAADGLVSLFRNLLHHHVHQSSPGPATTFWAGLGAVRRDAFSESGGFDAERFRAPSVEDIDLGLRLVERGRRIVLDPAVQGTHLKRWTLLDMIRTDFARRGVPWVALALRHPHGSTALNLGWRHRLGTACSLAAVGFAATGRPRRSAAALGLLVALNHRFYRLLLTRGPAIAAAGVGLHVVHHLTGAAAVPFGVARFVSDPRRREEARARAGG